MHRTRLTARGRVVVATALVALVGGAGALLGFTRAVEVDLVAPEDGAVLGTAALEALTVEVAVSRPELVPRIRVAVDGRDRTGELERSGNRVRWLPSRLADGEHLLTVALQRGVPYGLLT